MALTIMDIGPSALEVIITGTLEKADYEVLVPAIEKRIDDHGKADLLLNISHFHGWSPRAFWEDLKFDIKHYNHISRLALVAEDMGKQWMATLSKPFTSAEVRFFSEDAHETAREWVLGSKQKSG